MHTDVKPWRNRGETVLIPIAKSRKFVLRFRPGEPERLGVTAPLLRIGPQPQTSSNDFQYKEFKEYNHLYVYVKI